MSLYEALNWAGQAGMVAVALLALRAFVTKPDVVRRDSALMLGVLGAGVLFQQVRSLAEHPVPLLGGLAQQLHGANGGQALSWLSLLGGGLILAHPYLFLRLVGRFRPVPRRLNWVAAGGLPVCWALLALATVPPAPAVILALFAYFIGIEGYAAVQLFTAGRDASGVGPLKMRLAAAGSLGLVLTMVLAGAGRLIPEAPGLSAVSRLLVLGSVAAYYLAFLTPAWLAGFWRLREMERFLLVARQRDIEEEDRGPVEQACASATRATGALGSLVFLSDGEGGRLTLQAGDNPHLTAGGISADVGTLARAWRDGRPERTPAVVQLPTGERMMLDGVETCTALIAPLWGKEQAWGLLAAFLPAGAPFASEDLDLLDRLAAHCATVLDRNASLQRARAVFAQLEESNRKLRAGRARFQALFETAPNGIISTDGEGRILLINEVAERLFGYDSGALTGRFITELIAERFHGEHAERARRLAIRGESPVVAAAVELAGRRRDGTEFPLEISLSHWTADGRHSRGRQFFTAVLRDVTQRKQAQEAQQRLAAIVAGSDDAIIGKTLDGRITSWNEGAEALYGYSAREMVGHSIGLLIPDGRPDELHDILEQVGRGQPVQAFETLRRAKDGRLVDVSVSVSPIRDMEGRSVAAASIARNIGERKRAEQAMAERTAELETVNSDLEAFSYSVSHDLRAPLRAMDGFSRILLEDYGRHLPADGLRYLDLVRANAQQMGQLVDDLLAFARIGHRAVGKQPVDPALMVRRVFEDLAPEREGRQIDLVVQAMPECQGDPALLRQLWLNLVANALKYTRTRPSVRIEAGVVGGDGAPVYYLRDNGVGFDMRYAGKLFGVFERLHRQEDYEGTGVGLAIVQRIVHRHRGRIWAEAAVDQGACFFFTLGPKEESAA